MNWRNWADVRYQNTKPATGTTAVSPSGMGGRGSLSKTPSREPPRASRNQTTRTETVRLLMPWLGRVLSASGMMRSFETGDWSVSGSGIFICICNYQARKKGTLGLCLRLPQFPGRFIEQGNPLVPQQFAGPALGFLPGRDRLLDQPFALGRQPEGVRACVSLSGHH